MSHVIPISKVNQFLPQDKLELDTTIPQGEVFPVGHELIADLEVTGRDIVLSKLNTTYDVTTWLDADTTPSLVVNIIGLLVAGWVYDRQFSEETAAGSSYGQRRVEEAYALIDGLLDGSYTLEDGVLVEDISATGTPSVYASEPVFEMGEAF